MDHHSISEKKMMMKEEDSSLEVGKLQLQQLLQWKVMTRRMRIVMMRVVSMLPLLLASIDTTRYSSGVESLHEVSE